MAVLTMALGIASTTALFSVVYAVLLQPLAFPDPARLVGISTVWPAEDKTTQRMTGGDFLDIRSAAKSFSALAFYDGGEIGVRVGDHSAFTETYEAAGSFFSVLGVKPLLGHFPAINEHGQTAVVASSFADANFGSPAGALGQSVVVDNKDYRITAILPDALAFPEKAQVWITGPAVPENQNRTAFNYRAIGRVRPDLSLSEAEAELSVLGSRSAVAHPESNKDKTFRAVSLQEQLAMPVRKTLLLLLGAAGLLLLIASANVANLMLARAAVRVREIALRAALGASDAGIVRLLLVEGTLLGITAASIGVLLSVLALRAIFPLLPSTIPFAAEALHIHLPVLLFAIAASAFTVLICSLIPALHLRRLDLVGILKQAPSRGFIGGASRSRNFIVVGQVALCCILCVAAALFSRSMLALINTPLGVNSEGVLVMYADEPAFSMAQYLGAIRTFENVLEQIRRLPDVQSAAAVMGLPTGRYGSNGSYLVEGVHIQPGQDPFKMNWPHKLPWALFSLASPDYFSTVGIRLLAGRDFTPRDRYEAPFIAIISESLARQSFGTSDPIGRRIYCGLDSPKPMTIVGVVKDVRQDSPGSPPEPEIYMPFQQHPYFANELQLVMRTRSKPANLIPEVRTTLNRIDPLMAIRFSTFSEMVQDSVSAPRFRAGLAIAFALFAIALAMSGVYGAMMYAVTERRTEVGVRMALGATPRSVLGLISRRAFALAFAGLCLGLPASVALSRFASSLLYGIHLLDPATYLIGALTVVGVVLAAAFVPALRAARVDPAVALRSE